MRALRAGIGALAKHHKSANARAHSPAREGACAPQNEMRYFTRAVMRSLIMRLCARKSMVDSYSSRCIATLPGKSRTLRRRIDGRCAPCVAESARVGNDHKSANARAHSPAREGACAPQHEARYFTRTVMRSSIMRLCVRKSMVESYSLRCIATVPGKSRTLS